MKLACPYCKVSLTNELTCTDGTHAFLKKDGIYYLHKDDETWHEVEKEAVGSIEFCKSKEVYDHLSLEYIDNTPYLNTDDKADNVNRVMLDMCKKLIGNSRGSVLEIGSKRCWAVNQFTKMGFKEVVASDITDDKEIGLGKGGELIEHTGRHFERVLCDGAYLPFESNQFDVVFMCSTFHHIREKEKAISEIYRVLKPCGVFVAIGENPRHPDRSLEDVSTAVKVERSFNMNETQPSVEEYWDFLDKASFAEYFIYPFDGALLKDWNFDKDCMFEKIGVKALNLKSHKYQQPLYDSFSERTQLMLDEEGLPWFNYWLHVPDNAIMYGRKYMNSMEKAEFYRTEVNPGVARDVIKEE